MWRTCTCTCDSSARVDGVPASSTSSCTRNSSGSGCLSVGTHHGPLRNCLRCAPQPHNTQRRTHPTGCWCFLPAEVGPPFALGWGPWGSLGTASSNSIGDFTPSHSAVSRRRINGVTMTVTWPLLVRHLPNAAHGRLPFRRPTRGFPRT